jgi:hypothetical protein
MNEQQRIFCKKLEMKNQCNIPSSSHAVTSLGLLATAHEDNVVTEMSVTE